MSFKQQYKEEMASKLQKDLDIKNPHLVPKVEKIVLNMGIGSFIRQGNKDFSGLEKELALIAGQKPVVKYAKKSVSNFKLRAGMPVGLTVTLRGDRMYEFLEKMIKIVMPRIKDFRGFGKKSFDKQGNYNFWIKEHTIFPEVPQNDIVKVHGMQITVKTNVTDVEHNRALLKEFGFPFAK